MIVETTLRKALILRMGSWLVTVDREANAPRKELRKWIEGKISEQLKEAEVELLPRGGFTGFAKPELADLPVEIDFTVEQLGMFPTYFARGVVWPNLDDDVDEDVDALKLEVAEWGKQEAAARALRTLTPKQRKQLEEDKKTEEP